MCTTIILGFVLSLLYIFNLVRFKFLQDYHKDTKSLFLNNNLLFFLLGFSRARFFKICALAKTLALIPHFPFVVKTHYPVSLMTTWESSV